VSREKKRIDRLRGKEKKPTGEGEIREIRWEERRYRGNKKEKINRKENAIRRKNQSAFGSVNGAKQNYQDKKKPAIENRPNLLLG